MNIVVLTGRLTQEPSISMAGDSKVAHYTLAVNRDYTPKEGQQGADFISCTAFGKTAEFVEKFCHKGTKLNVSGRIQTGRYTNKDGQTIYTTEVLVNRHEFGESKKAAGEEGTDPAQTARQTSPQAETPIEEFVNIPDDVDDEELPFN